ncbi:MAG: potassium transporter TrkG [Pseudomonadota bacterium]
MRIFVVQRIVGAVIALAGSINLVPLGLSWWYDDGIAAVFIESLMLCLVVGFLLWLPVRNRREELRLRDGFLVVTLIWFLVGAACALPFMLGPTRLSYTDAYFEAVSGLTTTGATVLVGIERLPRSLLFYRQSLHFLGGMGIVILAVAILPMLRIGGSQLFRAESTGPIKDTRLTPRIAETAKALWLVYVGLNAACALAYWIGGMNVFDAITHAFATVATGGFGNYDASFGQFDSPLLEAIAILFMSLGGSNFAMQFLAWRRASANVYFLDSETRAYFAIIVAGSVVVALAVWAHGAHEGLAESLRHAAFHIVSNITTTGFVTTGFAQWPGYAPLLLILIGFIGGCSGSTSGGMKVVRVMLLFRQGLREIAQLVHPRGRFVVKLGGTTVSGAVLAAVTGFCTLYVACFTVMTLALAATGLDLLSAFSAVATCINNLGPGLGVVASTFRDVNDVGVWICSFAMLLGRLEIFTVLVLFTAAFWRE